MEKWMVIIAKGMKHPKAKELFTDACSSKCFSVYYFAGYAASRINTLYEKLDEAQKEIKELQEKG